MRKILIASLGTLVALVGAVLVVPSVIDWNAYKDEIAQRIGAATGRAVELRGDIGLTLLPSPALTVRDARLANPEGAGQPDMARLKQLDVQVSLGSLLRGIIQVESVTLVEPAFVVEILPDDRVNWDLTAGPKEESSAGRPVAGLFSGISFDQITIEGGTVLYHDARSGRSEQIENLDARVVAGSLGGPFQAQGTFTLHGVPLQGELTTGRFTEGAAVPVRASLSIPDGDDADSDPDASLRFAGIVTSGPNGGTRAQGDLRAEGGDLRRLAEPLHAVGVEGFGPALAQPFSLRAAIEASKQEASLSNLELQLGDTRANGSASVKAGTPAQAEVTLAVSRLDLDAWLDRAAAKKAPLAAGRAGGQAAAPAGGAATSGFSLPEALNGRLNLSVDGITYNGGLVRQGRLEASLVNGVIAIDRASALLPGGADIVGAGSVTADQGAPNLDLRVEANADDLRSLLHWLKLEVGPVPADRLRRASLATTFRGRPGRIDLTDFDLQVDSSRLTGAIAYVARERSAFGARLSLDRLNLDAYLPPRAAAGAGPAEPANGQGTAPAAGGRAGAKGRMTPADLLNAFDANLDLTFGQLTLRGLPMQDLRIDAVAVGGALTIRDAQVADLAGVKASVSGQIGALQPLRGVNLAVSAEAGSLAALSRALPWPSGAPAPERLGPVKAEGRLTGDAERMAVEMSLSAGGGTLEAGGSLSKLEEEAAADIKLRARHPELAQFAALFGGAAAPAASAPAASYGPLDFYAELTGTRRSMALNNIQSLVAGTSLRGRATAAFGGVRPVIEAQLETGALALDPFLAAPVATGQPAQGAAYFGDWADSSVNLAWLRGFDGHLSLTASSLAAAGASIDGASLRAALSDGTLTLERLDGRMLDGRVEVTGRLSAPAAEAPPGAFPRAELSATLSGLLLADRAPALLPLAGGSFDVTLALRTEGASAGAMLQSLAGEGRVTGRDGTLVGIDLAALRDRLARLDRPQDALEAAVRGFQGGQTAFSRLDGNFTIERGVARTDGLRMVTDAADATVVGQADLPTRTVDMRLRVDARTELPVPPLTLRATGPLDSPTRSFELREVQDFLARRALGGAP